MVLLKVYNLDDREESTPISSFCEGEHFIGRETLNCKDKRVSRNHAIILVNASAVILKSIHINPTFYKPNGGNSLKLVRKDESVIINDGDQFSFLADSFWFRTRVVANSNEQPSINSNIIDHKIHHVLTNSDNENDIVDDLITNTTEENQSNSKVDKHRHTSDSEESIDFADEVTASTTKDISTNDSKESIDFADEATASTTTKDISMNDSKESIDFGGYLENKDDIKVCSSNKNDSRDSVDFSNSGHQNVEDKQQNLEISTADAEKITLNEPASTKQNDDNCDNKTDNPEKETTSTNDDEPSTSTKLKRTRCYYGDKCFRKNVIHKQSYSHPGDSDYDEGDVPDCPYGSACYRKNVLHRQQFKHYNSPAPKPTPATTNVNNTNQSLSGGDNDDEDDAPEAKRKRTAATKVKYTESPEDDYDFEDPFINDGSSDDFQLTDDVDDDSEWEDSQEVEEGTQERKRLVKEAKKFTKQKNKK